MTNPNAHFPNTTGLQPTLPRRIRKPRVVPHTLYPTTRRPPSLPFGRPPAGGAKMPQPAIIPPNSPRQFAIQLYEECGYEFEPIFIQTPPKQPQTAPFLDR